MCPDNFVPRIYRFVLPGTLPGRYLLSILDHTKNLQIIDQDWFDHLGATDRHLVLRTRAPALQVKYQPDKLCTFYEVYPAGVRRSGDL